MRSGSSSLASASASASTRRPSASVLPISTVRPLRAVKTSPGRKAAPAMAFSTAGMRTRRRKGSPASMIMWARPSTLAAPPMSFFISSMPEAGLMSRPPESKHTPLPTKRQRRRVRVAPGEVDEARRARERRGGADGMDQREAVGKKAFADDLGEDGAVAQRQIAGGFGKLRRPEVVGGGVDEIARQEDAVGDAADFSRIDVDREHEAARRRRILAIAGEAIGAERPGEAGQRRIVEAGGEAIGTGRQLGRQGAGEKRRPVTALPEAEKHGGRAAIGTRHQTDLAGGGGEAGGRGPFRRPRGKRRRQGGKAAPGHGMNGNRRFAAVGGKQAIGHGCHLRGGRIGRHHGEAAAAATIPPTGRGRGPSLTIH